MKTKDKLKLICNIPKSFFYSKKYKKPVVMTDFETIDYVLKNNCSLVRYGDGELDLMLGIDLYFQTATPKLSRRLKEIAQEQMKSLLVCIPNVFDKRKQRKARFVEGMYTFWTRHLWVTRGYWYRFFGGRTYGDSLLSRFYLGRKDKSEALRYAEKLKTCFTGRSLVFVEGKTTRLGIGNDLFGNMEEENAKIKRILCPAQNAFAQYEQILAAVKTHAQKDDLIVCAVGPTATVLCRDLSVAGYQALDLGHIDSEYVLCQKAAGKPQTEAELNDKSLLAECTPKEMENYQKQIVCTIE